MFFNNFNSNAVLGNSEAIGGLTLALWQIRTLKTYTYRDARLAGQGNDRQYYKYHGIILTAF
jgi:hypothetical protein